MAIMIVLPGFRITSLLVIALFTTLFLFVSCFPHTSHSGRDRVFLSSSSSLYFTSKNENRKRNGSYWTNDGSSFQVVVTYEGRSCEIWVESGETVLSALERSGAATKLAIPTLPSDCRRGNCMTCSGKHALKSCQTSLKRGDDGLSPYMSKQVHESNYVLTCSSYVVGPGVQLELGSNNEVWKEMWKTQWEKESTRQVGREAMAKAIRLSDERNVPRWKKETEEVLQQEFNNVDPLDSL